MKTILLALALVLIALAASAQQPESPAAMRSLALALQQAVLAAEQYVADVDRRLQVKDARIAELLKLCGDPCKSEPGK
jgi:hypothetical protein